MLEEQINEMSPGRQVGPLYLRTDQLKTALISEVKAWTLAYGRRLNESSSRDMDALVEFFSNMQKRLSRPVKDLDDIRAHMTALCEIRDAEVSIDLTIAPIEDAYVMLGRYGLTFNDGNAERVDSLGYGWRLLRQQVITVTSSLFSTFRLAPFWLVTISQHSNNDNTYVQTFFGIQVAQIISDNSTRNTLDCDQSNVYSSRAIFSKSAFSFFLFICTLTKKVSNVISYVSTVIIESEGKVWSVCIHKVNWITCFSDMVV